MNVVSNVCFLNQKVGSIGVFMLANLKNVQSQGH